MTASRCALMIVCSALLSTCGWDGSLITIRVGTIPDSVRSLLVQLSSDEDPAFGLPSKIVQRLDTFSVKVPARYRGVLHIKIRGLGADDCQRALAEAPIRIDEPGHYDADVTLEERPEDRGCRLILRRVGDGGGRVTVQPGGIPCDFAPRSAQHVCDMGAYPLNSRVSIDVAPEGGGYPASIFGGLSGACKTQDQRCQVTIGQEPAVVQVGLLPRLTCSNGEFCWENPLPDGIGRRATWGFSASDIWAVGLAGLIQHWNGLVWTQFSSSTAANLRAVWGAGPDDVWAVGETRDSRGGATGSVIVHWDGVAWTPVPAGAEPTAGLQGVWGSGPKDVWAVGYKNASEPGQTSAAILHWDGAAWAPYPGAVPTPKGGNSLTAVWGSGPKDVWAVGHQNFILDGWALHWDGGSWALHDLGDLAQGALWGVGGTGPRDVWAVGRATLLRWDGSAWLPSAPGTEDTNYFAVWGAGRDDVWISGDGISHWDGRRVSRLNTDGLTGSTGLWGSGPNDVWAVGNGFEHWDGAAWTSRDNGAREAIQGLWGSGPDNIWAVGVGGGAGTASTMMHWNGVSWISTALPGNMALRSLWGSGPGDIWAVGISRTERGQNTGVAAVHWDGRRWTSVDTKLTVKEGLLGVWGSGPGDIWAVGQSANMFGTPEGVIVHWDGNVWSAVKFQTGAVTLNAIWGSGPSDIWAVGFGLQGGLVLRWDGTSWNPVDLAGVPDASKWNLTQVWGTGPDDVWVGATVSLPDGRPNIGALARWGNSGWRAMDIGTTTNVTGFWGSAADDVWAVGGGVRHWDGKVWTLRGADGAYVNCVWGSGRDEVWFGGQGGALLRRRGR